MSHKPTVIVPQDVYSTCRPYTVFSAITFRDTREPGIHGIRLQDALSNDLNELADPHSVPTLTTTAQKITLRINWPGCTPWAEVMHVYNHALESKPVTKRKLAQDLAKRVRLCLDDLRHHAASLKRTDGSWNVADVKFEELVLLELRHVSAGSWQPVLGIRAASARGAGGS